MARIPARADHDKVLRVDGAHGAVEGVEPFLHVRGGGEALGLALGLVGESIRRDPAVVPIVRRDSSPELAREVEPLLLVEGLREARLAGVVASVLAAGCRVEVEYRVDSLTRGAVDEPVEERKPLRKNLAVLGDEVAPAERQANRVEAEACEVSEVLLGPPAFAVDAIELVRLLLPETRGEVFIRLGLGVGDLVRAHPVLGHKPAARVDAAQHDRASAIGTVVECLAYCRHVARGLGHARSSTTGAERR